ncbi:TPA: hypothetical protein ACODIX_004635, partial [Salmonella enterica subsp. salamae serovar 1,4,12,[27]:b:[e,n,x]]
TVIASMMRLLLSAAEFLKISMILLAIAIYSNLRAGKLPDSLFPFLIDLPDDSLIFSIYIPRHDDLSGD